MKEIDFKDRIPTHAGRVKLTPVEGMPDHFALERADEPTEEGTPINKATLESITKSRLTGRYYTPEVEQVETGEVIELSDSEISTFSNSFVIAAGVPLAWDKGQRITIEIPTEASSMGAVNNTLNGVTVNTILQPSRKYELVYNGVSFDVKEV